MKHLKYIKPYLIQFFDVKINNDKSGKKHFILTGNMNMSS